MLRFFEDSGFDDVAVVHVGAGSVVVELSTRRDQAEVEKLEAEIANLKADTRIKNIKGVLWAGALVVAAYQFVDKLVDVDMVVKGEFRELVEDGAAEFCEIAVGACSFELILPTKPQGDNSVVDSPADEAVLATGDDDIIVTEDGAPIAIDGVGPTTAPENSDPDQPDTKIERDSGSEFLLEIWLPDDSGPLSIQRVQIPAYHQKSTTIFSGVVVNGDSTQPSIQTENGLIALSGLSFRLGIEDGRHVRVEAKAGLDGRMYPERISIMDYRPPPK